MLRLALTAVALTTTVACAVVRADPANPLAGGGQPTNPLAGGGEPENPLAPGRRPDPAKENPLVAAGGDRPAARAARVVRLARVPIPDTLCNNQTAATILIPADWRLEGGIVWQWNAYYPTAMRARVFNPRGPEQMTVYPTMLMVDGIRESTYRSAIIAGPEAAARAAAMWPEGSTNGGSEVRRLVADPAAAVRELVVPRLRPDLAGARVVGAQELPELAKAEAVQGQELRIARVRFAYEAGGAAVEEDVYCVVKVIPMPGTDIAYWHVDAQSFRAGAGQLDDTMRLFHAISRSSRLDLKWYAAVLDVQRQMQEAGRQAIADAGMLSQYIKKRGDEVSDIIRGSYAEQQRVNDRAAVAYSQSVRGVQPYTDPYDRRPVVLPSGYDHVYRNVRGEYLLTNDANYDPNVALREEWRKVTPAGR